MSQATSTTPPNEVLTFMLGNEHYAIDIQSVQEIKERIAVNRLPDGSKSLRGVINLRGSIVPILDLKVVFGMSREPSDQGIWIVLNQEGKLLAVQVDSVQDVVEVPPEAHQPPPSVVPGKHLPFQSFATVGERMLMVLDLDRALLEAN